MAASVQTLPFLIQISLLRLRIWNSDFGLRLVKNQTSSPRQSEHPGTRPALAQGPGKVTQRVHDLREGRLLMPNLFLKKYDQ